MLLNNKILECELEYIKCFSESSKNEHVIRFRDHQLNDMYYHNYTYIPKSISEDALIQIIHDEIGFRLDEHSHFCNILLNFCVSNTLETHLKYKPERSIIGFYAFDLSQVSQLKVVPGCIIKKASNQEIIEDILYCDLQHDEESLGRDFCMRRCYRRGLVYLSNQGVNSYVCYHNGEIIGNCDLFISNGVAKIEDFSVIPKHQRKGYGTTILKTLINIAINENCHTVYLGTDEDDTAKEMYQKIGFHKIGERTDLFFKLN